MKGKSFGKQSGFSLVEMLVVIAVIGLLAAIAVPQFGKVQGAASESKNQRNAQNAVSLFMTAKVAGHNFVAAATQPTSQHHVLQAIAAGATIDDPGTPFHGTHFSLPGLNIDQIYGAQVFLAVVDGELRYNPDGDSIDPVVPVP